MAQIWVTHVLGAQEGPQRALQRAAGCRVVLHLVVISAGLLLLLVLVQVRALLFLFLCGWVCVCICICAPWGIQSAILPEGIHTCNDFCLDVKEVSRQ